MRSAIEIANWFIENRGANEVSNLKIQKLLYIAFGIHFARENEHLFYDPIEAWKYGPVIQSVYHYLKIFGNEAIQQPIVALGGSVPRIKSTATKAIESLEETMERYGGKSAFELMRWSHSHGGPWVATYDPDGSWFQEIDKQLIGRFFTGFFGKELSGRSKLKSIRCG